MKNGTVRAANGAAGTTTGGVQSVDRAVSVLEILARRGEAGVSEVAADVGVHKSTAFRLLSALEGRELVEQTHERGKYRLSFGILRLAGAVPRRLDIPEQAGPVCRTLTAQLGETVNVAVLRSHFVVNLCQARGPSTVSTHNWIGESTPLHATSSGKILLAHMNAEQRRDLLTAAGLNRLTPRTITSAETLEEQLDRPARRLRVHRRGVRGGPQRHRGADSRSHRRGGRGGQRVWSGLPVHRAVAA